MRRPLTRLAAVHDLSGIGRTSLTVVLPVLAAMGVQACPLPTAVLSSQTGGFDDFAFVDLSEPMQDFLAHWKRLGIQFDALYSGFLGSTRQVDIVLDCIRHCLAPGALTVVDPVLGDNGKFDPTMNEAMAESLRRLIRHANCITPNLTEAALLLGEAMPLAAQDQHSHVMDVKIVKEWLIRLSDTGPDYTVITSVPLPGGRKGGSAAVAYDKTQNRFWKVDCEYIPAFYPGTGDTFTSVLTGSLLQGDSLPIAMDRAVQFVTLGIRATFGYNLPTRDGILLEKVLHTLNTPLLSSSYELLA